MNLVVQGSSNFTVSDRMKKYIEKRLKKINYFERYIKEIKFHLDHEKHIYQVDVVIVTDKFGNYKFKVQDREMYTAIDKVVHKVDVKIYREKSKIKTHSRVGHDQMVEFFNEHEKSEPESTTTININHKPTILLDAYLHMKQEKIDFYGFNYIDEDNNAFPAFLRILEDNIIYLFKRKDNENYTEYVLNALPDKIEIVEEIRDIPIKKLNLFQAQREILEQEYYYDLFIDNETEHINFLFKEGNGKWKRITV